MIVGLGLLSFLSVLVNFVVGIDDVVADHGGVGCTTNVRAPAVVSGRDGSYYRRVFFNANTSICDRRSDEIVFPMFADGCAAGPLLEACSVRNPTACSTDTELNQLNIIRSVRTREALQIFLPRQPPNVHNAIVLDRARRSSATGVVFLDETLLVVASYGMQRLYLYEYNLERGQANLLSSCATTGNPDLLDFDGRDMLVASQLMRGTQELYRVNRSTKTIAQHKEVYAFVGEDGPQRQWCHEAAFYPSPNGTIIVASSSRLHAKSGLMIRFFDYENNRVIAEFRMASHPITRGYKAQGIRFIDEQHFLADVTSFVVKSYSDDALCGKPIVPPKARAHSRLVLFKVNFSTMHDVLRDLHTTAGGISVVAHFDIGIGAVDGIAHRDGLVAVADQLNDRVLLFQVDVSNVSTPIRKLAHESGYLMPHGVAFSNAQQHVAVTCYGDNSVIISRSRDITEFQR